MFLFNPLSLHSPSPSSSSLPTISFNKQVVAFNNSSRGDDRVARGQLKQQRALVTSSPVHKPFIPSADRFDTPLPLSLSHSPISLNGVHFLAFDTHAFVSVIQPSPLVTHNPSLLHSRSPSFLFRFTFLLARILEVKDSLAPSFWFDPPHTTCCCDSVHLRRRPVPWLPALNVAPR